MSRSYENPSNRESDQRSGGLRPHTNTDIDMTRLWARQADLREQAQASSIANDTVLERERQRQARQGRWPTEEERARWPQHDREVEQTTHTVLERERQRQARQGRWPTEE